MTPSTLIVPGYRGSGPAHWQTWLQTQLPDSRRLSGVDWDRPVIDKWAAAVTREIETSSQPLWIVAHSFGCLATVIAAAARPDKVAGVLLVAPAEPERFTMQGARGHGSQATAGIHDRIPASGLGIFGLLIASRNDPWMRFATARQWAERWELALFDAGPVGHINVESGHGPWPLVLELYSAMRRAMRPQDSPVRSLQQQASGGIAVTPLMRGQLRCA